MPTINPVSAFHVEGGGDDKTKGMDWVDLTAALAHPFGMPYLRRTIESALSAVFIGSPHLALPGLNTYMSGIDDVGDMEVGWTTTDQQACLLLSAFDHGTRFTLSPGY